MVLAAMIVRAFIRTSGHDIDAMASTAGAGGMTRFVTHWIKSIALY